MKLGEEHDRAERMKADALANRSLAIAWAKAQGQCEYLRKVDLGRAAKLINDTYEAKAAASSDAYDSGYAAGRHAGARSCGAPHDPSTSPSTPGRSVPAGGLQDDLSRTWTGAYTPASPGGAVPGKHPGAFSGGAAPAGRR